MKMQNLCEIEELVPYEILENKKAKATYIMRGDPKEKALDIYHLIFAPTHACNLRCRHCYLPDHAKELLPQDIALKLVDEWSEIVLEERGQYGGIFHIKGGEPFVVPYLWDIVEKLTELQSLRLMITTNGTLWNEDILRRLRDCNNILKNHVTIIVSLDGTTEDIHAMLRGKGHFKKVLKFFTGLQDNGITFHLNCVLHTGNISETSAYINLAKEYGAAQVNFLPFVPRGIGSGFRQFQVPHLEVYHQLDTIYKDADDKTKELLAGSLPYIKDREASGHYQTSHECVAGYRGLLYITPDGNVFTCPNIVFPEFSVGNVFRQSLKEISKNLSILDRCLKTFSKPYICAGEKMLYERNHDQSNQKSLDRLCYNLFNTEGESLESFTKENLISYCFSRNW